MAPEWDFGLRVKVAREATGMTQVELARRVGLFQDKVSRIEKGHRLLKATDLLSMAAALDLPVLAFLPPEERVMTTKQLHMALVLDARMES